MEIWWCKIKDQPRKESFFINGHPWPIFLLRPSTFHAANLGFSKWEPGSGHKMETNKIFKKWFSAKFSTMEKFFYPRRNKTFYSGCQRKKMTKIITYIWKIFCPMTDSWERDAFEPYQARIMPTVFPTTRDERKKFQHKYKGEKNTCWPFRTNSCAHSYHWRFQRRSRWWLPCWVNREHYWWGEINRTN